jgi:hypothetical protein
MQIGELHRTDHGKNVESHPLLDTGGGAQVIDMLLAIVFPQRRNGDRFGALGGEDFAGLARPR